MIQQQQDLFKYSRNKYPINYYSTHFIGKETFPYTSIIKYMYDNFEPNIKNKNIKITDLFVFDKKTKNKFNKDNVKLFQNIKNKPNIKLNKLILYIYYFKSFSMFYDTQNNRQHNLLFLIQSLKHQIQKDVKRLNIYINDIIIDRELLDSDNAADILYINLIDAFKFQQNKPIDLNVINKITLLTSQNILNFITELLVNLIEEHFKKEIYIYRPIINIKININEIVTNINIIFQSQLIDINTTDIGGNIDFNILFDIKNNTFKFKTLLINLNSIAEHNTPEIDNNINGQNVKSSNVNVTNIGVPLSVSSALISTPFILSLFGGKKKQTQRHIIKNIINTNKSRKHKK